MNDLTVGVLLGLLGFGALLILTIFAYLVGKRGGHWQANKAKTADTSKTPRRIPTVGHNIPQGTVAQTQFNVTSSTPKSKASK